LCIIENKIKYIFNPLWPRYNLEPFFYKVVNPCHYYKQDLEKKCIFCEVFSNILLSNTIQYIIIGLMAYHHLRHICLTIKKELTIASGFLNICLKQKILNFSFALYFGNSFEYIVCPSHRRCDFGFIVS